LGAAAPKPPVAIPPPSKPGVSWRLFMKNKLEYATKKDLVVQMLRKAIATREYEPGERMRQEEIARRFDISLTPVREAFSQLEVEGIVSRVPHKGVRVARVTIDSAKEIYQIRSVLEALAVELATPDIGKKDLGMLDSLQRRMRNVARKGKVKGLIECNHEFHMTLYEASQSGQLYDMIASLWARFPWGKLMSMPGRAERSMEEHQKILNAIKDRNAILAAQLMRAHIEGAGEDLISSVGTRT